MPSFHKLTASEIDSTSSNTTPDLNARLSLYRLPGSGHGIRAMDRPLETGRMTRHLKRLGITPTQHNRWTGGMSLEEWLTTNPQFKETTWLELIVENIESIRNN